MSFSSEVKKELSNINIYSNKDITEAEFLGYVLSANCREFDDYIELITENEFNIERLYKLLFKLNIEYEPDTNKKVFIARIKKSSLGRLRRIETINKEDELKAIVRGTF